MKTQKLDPISIEIHWKRLVSIVDEAATAFIRTSFSIMAREANDFAVVMCDAQGRSIAQSSQRSAGANASAADSGAPDDGPSDRSSPASGSGSRASTEGSSGRSSTAAEKASPAVLTR